MGHTGWLKAGLATLAGAGAAATVMIIAAMGPLDPPPGAVSPTSPSLADLEDKLDQVLAAQAGSSEITGPWEVFRVPATGELLNNTQSTLVVSGRVYVHSLTVYQANAVVFDGAGSISVTPNHVLSGDWISRHYHIYGSSGTGRGQKSATTVPVGQIVEDGLHVAWNVFEDESFLYVLYKELP